MGPIFARKPNRRLPRGTSFGDYRQFLLGQDISFALHHLQLWAEFYEVRFQVPRIGDVDTFAYYLEAKYKFTPQFFAALRWNQQLFSDDSNRTGYERSLGSRPLARRHVDRLSLYGAHAVEAAIQLPGRKRRLTEACPDVGGAIHGAVLNAAVAERC